MANYGCALKYCPAVGKQIYSKESIRRDFENRIFVHYLMRSLRPSAQPNVLDLVPDAKIREAPDLLKRDISGNYVDEYISAMWFAWTLAVEQFLGIHFETPAEGGDRR